MKKTKMLKKNYEFKNVLSKGISYYGNFVQVVVKKNNSKFNFLGIAISVKIAKAVKRNKIKRLIRENYRLMESSLKTGNSIVFLWNKNADTKKVSFNDIKIDVENVFRKSGILEEKA